MKNILAPIDFSDVTPQVVDFAVEMARACGGTIYLLHAVPQEVTYGSVGEVAYMDPSAPLPDPYTDAVTHHPNELKKLNDLADSIRAQQIDVDVIFIAGSAVDAILDAINSRAIDLVVMGSHGHSRLYELIVGTVTESVMRRSHKPVLIVPSLDLKKRSKKRDWSEPVATGY